MHLAVLGVSHHTAPIAVRERLSLADGKDIDLLAQAGSLIAEGTLLSTCNRTEVYYAAEDVHKSRVRLVELLTYHGNFAPGELEPVLYFHEGERAVRHLFRVVSGLDALVVGETQIIAQARSAHAAALRAGLSGPHLSPLFQEALAVAKKVQTDTGIGRFGISVGHAAVELAESVLGDLAGKGVLLIGAGELAELCLTHLRSKGARRLLVANRTLDAAVRLARDVGGEARPFTALIDAIVESDIVIGSTAAPHAILDAPAVADAMARRRGGELFFFDMAVPRDFETGIGDVPGVHLFDIDDLEQVVALRREARLGEAREAEGIVGRAARLFTENQKARRAVPVIRALTERADDIRRAEVERALRRLPDLDDSERQVIEAMTSLLVRKLLNDPFLALKEMAKERDGERQLAQARRLFNLPDRKDEGDFGVGS